MPAISQSACGKAILLGEHAVVYGQPAIAIPLSAKRVSVRVEPQIIAPTRKIRVIAPFLDLDEYFNEDLPEQNPIFQAIKLTLKELKITETPSCTLHISSALPISSGLGSSAALAVATIRSLSEFLGHPFNLETVNRIAYECETTVHGKPSGIDNTVVTYEKPVYFRKNEGFDILQPAGRFVFVLADSGVSKSTRETVAELALKIAGNSVEIEPKLSEIGHLVLQGKQAILNGNIELLAEAMNRNQALLAELGLSSPELDSLIAAALKVGALAAKMTGGGRGGHMLALVEEERLEKVLNALQVASDGRAFYSIIETIEGAA